MATSTRTFGVVPPERTYLPPEDIPRIFQEDPERLMAYARDDVAETLGLGAILSPPYFVQAQSLPFDYQTTVLRGNATKVDALLMRAYLHRGQAIPAPRTAEPTTIPRSSGCTTSGCDCGPSSRGAM